MARMTISGIGIEYELLGRPSDPAVALTPGGRFSKDTPGLAELGRALAAGGRRVLLWDRPNCGASDICFDADTESQLNGRILVELIRALDLGPTALAGGSAGSRVSLVAASRAPEMISHMVLWWISGGAIGLFAIATYYYAESAIAASRGGMAAVAALPAWAEQLSRNPRNRDIILAQEPEKFIALMERWLAAFTPPKESPVPGMSPEDFKCLRMPTLVFRSGKSDLSHPRRTSEWVSEMLPNSKIIDPPWGDSEWNDRSAEARKSGGQGHFRNWPRLAPFILDFIKK